MTQEMESIWKRYWEASGGWHEIVYSKYTWGALAFTAVGFGFWLEPEWWEVPLAVLPNLLGFSLGGAAILFGVIQPNVLRILRRKVGKSSASVLSQFTAAFTDFVLVQAGALLAAIILKSAAFFVATKTASGNLEFNGGLPTRVFQVLSGFSWFLFIYAVMLTFATAIEVFRISDILQTLSAITDDESSDNSVKTPRDSNET